MPTNPELSAFAGQLSINLFPLVIIATLFLNNRRGSDKAPTRHAFGTLALTMFISIALYVLTWLADGWKNPVAFYLNWLFNGLYFVMSLLCACAWLRYVSLWLYGKDYWLRLGLMVSPAVISLLLVLSSPLSHAIFYIAPDNCYVRGSLYIVPYASFLFMMLLSAVMSVVQCLREPSRDKRSRSVSLAMLSILPVPVAVVQALFDGWWIMWPLCAIGLLAMYISLQNRRMVHDPLTGLSNRSELERVMRLRIDASRPDSAIHLLIVDVDRFKSINDRFGHAVGDEALRRVADILRDAFDTNKAFISRCGGDEFAVLTTEGDHKSLVEAVIASVERNNKRVESPYSISLSVGCATRESGQTLSAAELYSRADRAMYVAKAKNIDSFLA